MLIRMVCSVQNEYLPTGTCWLLPRLHEHHCAHAAIGEIRGRVWDFNHAGTVFGP